MPSYHIWIKKEDDEKWRAIDDRPKWISERLNEPEKFALRIIPPVTFKEKMKPSMKFVGTDENPTKAYNSVASQLSQCPHYQPKGQCLVKGCKYGR